MESSEKLNAHYGERNYQLTGVQVARSIFFFLSIMTLKLWIRQCSIVWQMHWICRSTACQFQHRLDEMKLIQTTIKSESESVKRSLPNLSNSYEQIDLWALTIPSKSAHLCWVNDIFKRFSVVGEIWMEGLYCTSASVYSVKCNYCCVSRRYYD